MLRKIRRGIFETNSSSVHSISIVAKEDFEAWKNGKLYFDKYNDELVNNPEDAKYPEDCQTYEQYMDDMEFETFYESYKSKSGDEIVAFGYYGHD
jgi:hypothetical protein